MIIALVVLAGALIAMRRMSKKGQRQQSYVYCQFCKQSVPVRGHFRSLSSHHKAVHTEYWRWNRKTGLVFFSVWVLILASLFVVLGLGLVPATGNSPLTWNFFIGWAASFFGFGALFAVYRIRSGRRFQGSAMLLHATPSRTYGNLRGMRVVMKFSQRRRGRVMSLLSLLEPISIVFEALQRLVLWKLEKFVLDRYEDGTLWYYSLGDMLDSLELKSSTLTMVHEKRLKVEHAGGTVEIETETVSELDQLRGILSDLPGDGELRVFEQNRERQ